MRLYYYALVIVCIWLLLLPGLAKAQYYTDQPPNVQAAAIQSGTLQAYQSVDTACTSYSWPSSWEPWFDYCGNTPINSYAYQCQTASNGSTNCTGASFTIFEVINTPCGVDEELGYGVGDYLECVPAAAPPPDQAFCDELESSWQNDEISFIPSWTNGSDPSSFCTPRYSEDDQECQDVLGYFNGIQLCNDDKNECEATGGTYGAFGIDGDIETAICLPADYADELPTCDISSVQILTVNSTDDVGGFGCSSTLGEIEDPVEGDITSEEPEESDIDGDGIPDRNDADMDGDGILNGSDPDADGDGIADVDDPEVGGDDQESSVSGGGSCDVRPACTGDAVQCAILRQTWETRCALQRDQDDDGFEIPDPSTGPGLDDAPTGPADYGDTDLGGVLDDIFAATGPAGSCPAGKSITLSIVPDVTFSYQPFCDFAALIRPFVLLIFGWVSARIGLRAFEVTA
jgi:hypothetical protein